MSEFFQKILDKYNELNQFGRWFGMEITEVKEGHVRYEMTVQEHHLATPVAAHGGIIAGFMDGILGVAALSVSAKQEKLVSTVEFKINYMSPAKVGDHLVGTGKVINKGNRIIVTSGEIICEEDGRLLATALGTFNAYPYQKSMMEL